MKSKLKFIFLAVILLIPVAIFLFLKMFGSNQFSIPVYFATGVPPDQQFNCSYPEGPYTVAWPAGVTVDVPALLYFPEAMSPTTRNMIRRIVKNREGDMAVYTYYKNEAPGIDGVTEVYMDSSAVADFLHCHLASDSLDQWILIDKNSRIRGYYNVSLEEQDRLLNELSILLQE